MLFVLVYRCMFQYEVTFFLTYHYSQGDICPPVNFKGICIFISITNVSNLRSIVIDRATIGRKMNDVLTCQMILNAY